LPTAEHQAIKNLKGPANLTPRQQLALDLKNLRKYTNAPVEAQIEISNFVKKQFPWDLKK
jgi:hypothetical protein